jgi:hypothetical protein
MAEHDNKKRTFSVVVNAEAAEVKIKVEESLSTLVEQAVKETDNEAGHPLTDWEIRDRKGGPPLDQSRRIADYNFPTSVTLYIDLKVGGGG